MGVTGREGRLSWEARAEEVSFEVLPKRCNRGTISYMEKERVPEGRGIVTEGIRKVFKLICELYNQKWGFEGT